MVSEWRETRSVCVDCALLIGICVNHQSPIDGGVALKGLHAQRNHSTMKLFIKIVPFDRSAGVVYARRSQKEETLE